MRRLSVFVWIAGALAAAPPQAAKTGLDPERLARIPVRMKSFVDKGEIAGAVTLLSRRGVVASLEAVGYQDLESQKPMRPDSIFQLMSMTKPVTAVAIMMLLEEGKLALNDPVEKHLPEFRGQWVIDSRDEKTRTLRKPSRPITIRDLLTHTSGMPSSPPPALAELYRTMDKTLAEAVAIYSQQPLEFDPGARWLYSNTGIATLGRIIEVASDQSFENFLQQRIFEPLGMKDSFLFAPAEKRGRIATLYRYQDGKLSKAGPDNLGGDSTAHRPGAKYSAPEFGLYSTASDLAAFYTMMLNGGVHQGRRLLSRASVEVMTALHTGNLKSGHSPGTGFGLGWEVVKEPLGTQALQAEGAFGHGGAFGTYGWVDPRRGLVGVFLIQRTGGRSDLRDAFLAMAAASITAE